MTKGAKILVADDDRNMRNTLTAVLREEGYEVTTVDSGEQAVEVFERTPHDIVLMDVRMPGLDGLEAFRRIQRRHPHVRVILMSAYSVDEIKRRALNEGAEGFLAKPLDLAAVLRIIGEARQPSVLVLESQPDEATRLREGLTQGGYRVAVTSSPHDALEFLDQIRVDTVLLDLALLTTHGLDLYREITLRAARAVVVLTASTGEELKRLAISGVPPRPETLLRKPFELETLLDFLDEALSPRLSDSASSRPGRTADRKPGPDDKEGS